MDNDKGFQKLDIKVQEKEGVDVKNLDMNMKKRKRNIKLGKFNKSKFIKFVGIPLVVLALIFAFIGFRGLAIYKQAMKVKAQAKIAAQSGKEQNIEKLREELVKTQTEIKKLDSEVGGLSILKFVPLINGYFNDMDYLVNASVSMSDAGLIAVDALIPYADVLGLKGGGTFTGGTAQDRIRTAVTTMGKVVPEIDKIEAKLKVAKADIDKVNPKHYPEIGKLKEVRAQLQSLKDITDGAVIAVEQGKPLIKSLPTLLGEKESQKYLILFQNDAELRPTGGFLTYYAIFRIEEGVIKIDSSSDIYDLDNRIPSHPAAPEIIKKYLPKVNQGFIRDSNLSPDFVVAMNEFNKLYDAASGNSDIDGIVALDTQFLVNIIRILGEVNAGGLSFKADNDERCDCPQVVFTLENEISRPVNYVKTDRKGLLGDLMLATMDKALSSSPGEYWGRLFQQFVVDANEKHILFYVYEKEAQKGLEALNWSGRVRDFDGDYLYVNDANFGGQKSNLFTDKTMEVEYTVQKDGKIKKKITIEYKNPEPYSDCNLERGGLCLNATLRNYQRLLVPKGSILESSKGSQVKVGTNEDLGKTYFDAFFTVNPQGKASMTYEYTLPFKVEKGSELPLLIQKQPGVEVIPTKLKINGKTKEEFDLRTDRELSLDLF